jgi:hypothetical protein
MQHRAGSRGDRLPFYLGGAIGCALPPQIFLNILLDAWTLLRQIAQPGEWVMRANCAERGFRRNQTALFERAAVFSPLNTLP